MTLTSVLESALSTCNPKHEAFSNDGPTEVSKHALTVVLKERAAFATAQFGAIFCLGAGGFGHIRAQ